jgi:hypothetical protein
MALPLFLLLGCKKKIDELFPPPPLVQLPSETQSGANTFGCILNDQVWEASSHGSIRPFVFPSPDASYARGTLILGAGQRTEGTSLLGSFRICLGGVKQPGTYVLSKPPIRSATNYGYAEISDSNSAIIYKTDSTHIGVITITRLDTASARPFVAGRFVLLARPARGTAVPAGFPAEANATQGRFDVQLNRP